MQIAVIGGSGFLGSHLSDVLSKKGHKVKITVLGGSGFIGSHVADELSKRGYQVKIFDKKKSKWLRNDQKMLIGDIFNYKALENAIIGSRIVYNFAALSDIDYAKYRPIETVKLNIL